MKTQIQITCSQYSDRGVKPTNQDFHRIQIPNDNTLVTKGIVAAIADGISSSQFGHIASQTAVNSFIEDYYSTSESWSVKTSGLRVLKAINSWLHAQTQNSPDRFNKDKGYICTFSAIIIKGRTAHIFHCGDSRIYKISSTSKIQSKSIELLTKDHRKMINEETSYLTRALGVHNYLEVDYLNFEVTQGDQFFLCTDGVYEFIDTVEEIEAGQSFRDIGSAAYNLVQNAISNGSDDNLTAQVISVEKLGDAELEDIQTQAVNLPLPPKLEPRKEFDGFTILRNLYVSSRSHVYLAINQETSEKVAIKVPSAEMRENQTFLENFWMEDWIAKKLDNPFILKSVSNKKSKHYLYSITEYFEGQTLKQWMADHPSPNLDSVRSIVRQIAKGLQGFHRQEMVHQDLRPENILIDKHGTVKIIDFGSTKVAGISEIIPRNEGMEGTYQYMAPEYFLGESGNHQSDIFSLAVITYELLSGKLPYGIEVSRINDHRTKQKLKYRSLNLVQHRVPNWVDFSIQKALQVNRNKRYQEVSEFVFDLNQPNPSFLNKQKPPLIERNPVMVWQSVSLILLLLLIYQST